MTSNLQQESSCPSVEDLGTAIKDIEIPAASKLDVSCFTGLSPELEKLVSGAKEAVPIDRRPKFFLLRQPEFIDEIELEAEQSSSHNFVLEFRPAGFKSYQAAKLHTIADNKLTFEIGEYVDAFRIRAAASMKIWKDHKLIGIAAKKLSKHDLSYACDRYRSLSSLKSSLGRTFDEALDELQDRQKALDQEIEDERAEIEAEKKALQEDRKKHAEEVKAKEKEKAELEKQIAETHQKAVEIKAATDQAESDLKDVRAELAEKQNQSAATATHLTKIENELAIKTNDLSKRTKEVSHAKDELQDIANKTSLYATTLEGHCLRNKRIKRAYLLFIVAPSLLLASAVVGFGIYGAYQLWFECLKHPELSWTLAGIKILTGLPVVFFTLRFVYRFAAPFVKEIRRIDAWESELEAILLMAARTSEAVTHGTDATDEQKIESRLAIRGEWLEAFLTRHKEEQSRNEIVTGERLAPLVRLLMTILKNPKAEVVNLVTQAAKAAVTKSDNQKKS